MSISDIKEQIKKNVKVEVKYPSQNGGQSCGNIDPKIILKSEELDLEITVGYHRSKLRNSELALTLFELTLDELIK